MKKALFDELLESLREAKAVREGKKKPFRVTRYKALNPKVIRAKSGLTQERFAALLGVKVATYRNWEQGRRVPHGPAQVLLMVADYSPTIIREALRAQRQAVTGNEIMSFAHREPVMGSTVSTSCPAPLNFSLFSKLPLFSSHAVNIH